MPTDAFDVKVSFATRTFLFYLIPPLDFLRVVLVLRAWTNFEIRITWIETDCNLLQSVICENSDGSDNSSYACLD